MPEIKISNQGPPCLINAGDNNQIIFRINSNYKFESNNPNFHPETVTDNFDTIEDNQGRKIVFSRHIQGGGNQEIEEKHMTLGDKQLFFMKVKKNPDGKDKKKRNIELEVMYPKLPPSKPPTPPTKIQIETLKPPEILSQPQESKIKIKKFKKNKKKNNKRI